MSSLCFNAILFDQCGATTGCQYVMHSKALCIFMIVYLTNVVLVYRYYIKVNRIQA